jgi:hypothetical protein
MEDDNKGRWPTRFEARRNDQHRVAVVEQIKRLPTGRLGLKRREAVPEVKPAGEFRTDHGASTL